jgi:hypothetical protein
VVEYDFILTLAPGRTRPICYNKIIEFLCWLRDICGYRFALITADSFQSHQMRQTLYAKGFTTELLSVDRKKDAYLAWQGGFQEHCIRLYRQPQLLKEMAELIELDSKIDHAPGGGKDTSDAAAGCYFSAISSEEVRALTIPDPPAAFVGISVKGNASPEDPFGFTNGFHSVPVRKFKV